MLKFRRSTIITLAIIGFCVVIAHLVVVGTTGNFPFERAARGGIHDTYDPDPITSQANHLKNKGAEIHTALQHLIIREQLSPDDIYEVDFSLPGDEAYGDNPSLEIFNPTGRNAEPISPSELIPFGTDSGFIFTVGNRVVSVGTDQPELLAILPSVNQEICERLNLLAGSPDLLRKIQELNLTPFPQHAASVSTIQLSSKWRGCIRTAQGIYYVHILYDH